MKKRNTSLLLRLKKRSQWGVGKEIEEYRNTLLKILYDEEQLKTLLKTFLTKKENYTSKESFIDDLLQNYFAVLNEKLNKYIVKIKEIIYNALTKAQHRVIDKKGNIIKFAKLSDKSAAEFIKDYNLEIISKNLAKHQEIIKEELTKGIEEGLSNDKIAENINERIKKFSHNKAKIIARTEIIRAHTYGLYQTMKESGIKKYMWVTARDDKVCIICKHYDGKVFDINSGILPVKSTHVNCRCSIVKAD